MAQGIGEDVVQGEARALAVAEAVDVVHGDTNADADEAGEGVGTPLGVTEPDAEGVGLAGAVDDGVAEAAPVLEAPTLEVGGGDRERAEVPLCEGEGLDVAAPVPLRRAVPETDGEGEPLPTPDAVGLLEPDVLALAAVDSDGVPLAERDTLAQLLALKVTATALAVAGTLEGVESAEAVPVEHMEVVSVSDPDTVLDPDKDLRPDADEVLL